MFEIFWEEQWITLGMAVFFGLSILLRVLLGLLYQNMIRETDNMASTKNRLLKQCKVKFANCYQLNRGVSNIPVFVDKFLNRLSFGPVSFDMLYHLSGQSMLLSVVCAGAGICKSIMKGRMLGEILPFYIISFLGLYLYFTVSTLVDIRSRKRVLKVNLVDYLENHLSARMEVTENDMEMLYGRPVRRGRETGKRTVELMPIRGRLALADAEEETAARQQYRRLQEETEREERIEERFHEAVLQEDTFPKEPQEEYDYRVTGEELEELLKELLTV